MTHWESDDHQPGKQSRSLRPFNKEKYETILALVQDKFYVPCSQRSTVQKTAVVQFWRHRHDFSADNGKLFHRGREVVLKSELKLIVGKKFKQNKGSGARAISHQMREKYSGLTEKEIAKALAKSKAYQKQYARFTNKAAPITITASKPCERWQIDLMDMQGDKVKFDQKEYKYILTILDVYSRFLILRPLERKRAKDVAFELSKVMAEHGFPRYIQCDNGTEFKGPVERLLKHKGVNLIHSRPYHPQSQGKCERSHRVVRQKISYNTRRKVGYNWAANLHKIQSVINNLPKAVLGHRTPYIVYYNRVSMSDEGVNMEERIENLAKSAKKITHAVNKASKTFAERGFRKHMKANKCSVYNIGEQVLVKYPFDTSRVPRKRYVLRTIVEKRKVRIGRYFIRFISPDGKDIAAWVNVDHITSLTAEIEKERRNTVNSFSILTQIRKDITKASHKQRFYVPLTHGAFLENLDLFSDGSIYVMHDPTDEPGSCQFASVSHQLTNIGIHRTTQALRMEAVKHIRENTENYRLFIEGDFQTYCQDMENCTTFGDHITLLALAREYNAQFLVVSATGLDHTRLVSNSGIYDSEMHLFSLGYFPENAGEHYVSIFVQQTALSTIVEYLHDGCVRNALQTQESLVTHGGIEYVSSHEDRVPGLPVCHDAGRPCSPLSHTQHTSIPTKHVNSSDSLPPDTACIEHNRPVLTLSDTIDLDEPHREALPREIQYAIIHLCLANDPSSRFALQRVNSFFNHVINQIPLPRIYLSPGLLDSVPDPVSVRRLTAAAGRSSGLALEIRRILNNSRWYSAWLFLSPSGYGWYVITNIWWRRQPWW